jgi:hypothetical protein
MVVMTEKRMVVPYITMWSGEDDLQNQVQALPGHGIRYVDEVATDRDTHNILWYRTASRPGQGRPIFGQVNSLRQRRAMRRTLCQVCGGSPDVNDQGVLWLLQDHREDWPGWPTRMAVTEPPICLPCAKTTIRLCPALRKSAVAVRVKQAKLAGVHGVRYAPDARPINDALVEFRDPNARWVVARNLVRELQECRIVPIPE